MNSRRRFRSAASICQGTRLEWCSISVRMTTSPGCRFARPQVLATRLIDSVVLRVKITWRAEGAWINSATCWRAAS